MKTVLFVCTGNYYRSRLAEILFNYYALEMGIPWRAESRGLSTQKSLKGIAHYPVRYLEARSIPLGQNELRDPIALSVDDFSKYDITILMNKGEHLAVMQNRFSWMVKALEKENKLRVWNVHDIQQKANPLLKMTGFAKDRIGQPEESAVEHIDFGVRALIQELAATA